MPVHRSWKFITFYTLWPVFALWPLEEEQIKRLANLPKILPLPDDKRFRFAEVGQPISLKCPVNTKDDPFVYIEWFKEGSSLYLEDGFVENSRKLLRIKNVTAQDQGRYTCAAINGHGSVTTDFYLMVKVLRKSKSPLHIRYSSGHHELAAVSQGNPPHIVKEFSPQHLKQELGGHVELQCLAKGDPTPHIFWLKDGDLLAEKTSHDEKSKFRTQSTYVIDKFMRSDAGHYKCLAINELGKDQTDFSLEVVAPLYPPQIESLNASSSTILDGQTVVFKCKGKSIPFLKLHIKWMKLIPEDELSSWNRTFSDGLKKYRALDMGEDPIIAKDGSFQSELVIPNATIRDSGIYICLAVNDKGYRYKNVSLTVSPKIIWPTAFLVSDKPPLLVMIVLSIGLTVILSPVIFVVFRCCRCHSTKSIPSVQTPMEVQGLTSVHEPMTYQKQEKENYYCSSQTRESFVKPHAAKLFSGHISKAYERSNSISELF